MYIQIVTTYPLNEAANCNSASSAQYRFLVYGHMCNEYEILHDLSCMSLEGY